MTFAATGQGPFGEGRTEALAYRVVHAEPVLDSLPEPPRGVVARCLAKDPRQRPGPGQVITALAAIPAASTGEGWLPEPVEQMVGQHQAVETAAIGMVPVPPTQPPREDVAAPTMTPYEPAPPQYQPTEADLAGPAPPYHQPAAPGPAGPVPARPPAPSAAAGPPRRPRGWILGAVALVVVLAVAGFVAANRLSAKTPVPPASTAPPPAASSTTTSPSATPSPSGTGSAGVAGSGPAATVQAYYAAINNHDCATAWSLGGDNISAANGQSYQQFCQGFSNTSRDVLTVDSVAGNTVNVTIVAQHTDGSSQTFQGSYVVGNGVIDSASIQQSG
jgi:serine/threonine kinase PknH